MSKILLLLLLMFALPLSAADLDGFDAPTISVDAGLDTKMPSAAVIDENLDILAEPTFLIRRLLIVSPSRQGTGPIFKVALVKSRPDSNLIKPCIDPNAAIPFEVGWQSTRDF